MKPTEMHLFTNRNCLIFDEDGNQMCEYQSKISHSHVDKKIARKVIGEVNKFYLCKFKEWIHEISMDDMKCMLGVHDNQLVDENNVCHGCGFNHNNKKCVNTGRFKKIDYDCVVCGSSHECLYYNGGD